MKTKYLLLVISVAVFASCTTMYKTGQTPDDVYYSPVRTNGAGADETADDAPAQPQSNNNYYSGQDRMIRMGITDYRYRSFDNDYSYSPYNFSYSMGNGYGNYGYGNYGYNNYGHGNYFNDGYLNPYSNSIYYGNYYYNPYYNAYPIYVLPAGPLKNTTPRTTNLNGYGRNYNNTNIATPLAPHPTGNYNNTNRNRTSGLGNILNRVLAPATNNNTNNTNNNTQTTTRTYTPPASNTSSSSSSSSGSSGSSSGHISRPH